MFARLALKYGKHWLDMWAHMPMDAVKAEWSDSLAAIKAYQIEAALNHVGKFPPTLPEFKLLCDQFRAAGVPMLAIVDARRDPMPQHVRDAIAKLRR